MKNISVNKNAQQHCQFLHFNKSSKGYLCYLPVVFSYTFSIERQSDKQQQKKTKMVSQVMCLICSVTPDVNTAEITFHKLPNPIEAPGIFAEWKKALATVAAVEISMTDSYICSRHFQAADFAFSQGKLILLKNAIPSRIEKEDYTGSAKAQIDYEPSANCNNFATTSTKDHMTTSSTHLQGAMVCTETSRVLTPTVTEYIMAKHGGLPVEKEVLLQATRKRNADLEIKIQEFHKIFKRLRNDNLLTETYVNGLKV